MRGLACLGLALAACGDRGVVIFVDPMDATVAHVRLYIGQGDRTDAPYLQTAPSAATTLATAHVDRASYWARDPHNSTDVMDIASGESAGFTLVSTGQDTIPIIIAVGYDAQWNPVGTAVKLGVDIPSSDLTGYHIALHAPVSPLLDGASPRQLALWSDDATPRQDAACAGLVLETGQSQRVFVVTDDDQDCDGLVTDDPLECDPDAYLGTRGATRDELSCLAKGGQLNACYLGGATCTDGVPRDTTACQPTNYCTHTSTCTACGTNRNGADLDCATDVTPIATVTAYRCPLAVETSGAVCQDTLVLERPPTGGFDCNAVAIRDLADKRFSNHAVIGGLELQPQLDESCNVMLHPSGTVGTPFKGGALLAIDLDNGFGLGAPVTFAPQSVGSCAVGVTVKCQLDAPAYEADLTQCMAGWNAPALVDLAIAVADTNLTDPTLPENESELFYVAGGDIWVAKRDAQTGAWLAGSVVADLSSMETEASPDISADGKTMLFASGRGGLGMNLYVATRSDPTSSTWSTPTPLIPAMNGVEYGGASADETGAHVVLSVDDNGTGYRLEEWVEAGTGYAFVPTIQLGLPIGSAELSPYLTPDGLHLYFASDAALAGASSTELYVVSRNTIDDVFANPVLVRELGSPKHDEGPWVSRDGHTMYYASSRSGVSRIYHATR